MLHFNSNGMVFILFCFFPHRIIWLIHWSFLNLFVYFIHLFQIGVFLFLFIYNFDHVISLPIHSFCNEFVNLFILFQVRVLLFWCSHFTFSYKSTTFDKETCGDNNTWKSIEILDEQKACEIIGNFWHIIGDIAT